VTPLARWATFDCYGTLIDWERGIADTFAQLWPDADPRTLLARYHEFEPEIEHGTGRPYAEVLTAVLERIASSEHLRLDAPDALVTSLPEWPPFSEVPAELEDLRARGWKLAILSNTDPELLDASIKRIGVDIDLRITVAEAGSYKPATGHWDAFFTATDADRAGHVHVAASLFHDIAPCSELGLRCVWINRLDAQTDLAPTAELADLRTLGDVLDDLVQA
jgi:2-haloacid dehalogenase